MSLLRTIALKAPRAPLAATSATTVKQVRFSTSPFAKKDAGSAAVKDTIDSVNKTVGDAAVKGIEKGRELAYAFLHPPLSALQPSPPFCSLPLSAPLFLFPRSLFQIGHS